MDQKPEGPEQGNNKEAELMEFYGEEWEAIKIGKLPKERHQAEATARALELKRQIQALEEEKERLQKENEGLKEENAGLATKVKTDTLIESVFSHGHFLQLLEDEVAATQRMPTPSSFLLTLDLDHFGQTDEMLGHPTADQLLIAVGETLSESLRPGDSPGRTGGDEFSVVARRTDRNGAIIMAERIRKAVTERVGREFQQEGFSQRVSIGLCMIPKGLSTKEVRDIADAALYTVKNNGRNQIAEGALNPQTGSIETAIVSSESTSAHT